jgi:outer membrane lipase/esterase
LKLRIAILATSVMAAANPASAQSFNQAVVFGDSSVDSGNYRSLASPLGSPAFNALWLQGTANGAGVPTSSPGLMNSELLAARFGLTALPSNEGGTNFATSGAKDITVNSLATGGLKAAVPTVTQIGNYLAANNGHANSNALYLISSGGNDVAFALHKDGIGPFPADPAQYLSDSANSLATAVAQLQAAGARFIIVPGQSYSFPNNSALARSLFLQITQDTWSALSAAGVKFIPADINAFRLAIAANPAAFGFQFIDTAPGHFACTQPAGVITAWALLCSSNPNAPSHLTAPGADLTDLFADDQHFATAGQKIESDYFYNLIVAPSEISFLAENAVQARLSLVKGIQEQIDISQRERAPGFNMWANGDLSTLDIKNSDQGFSGIQDPPASGTWGADYRWANGFLLGTAVTFGSRTPGFDLGGRFTQNEVAASGYGGYHSDTVWADLIATYGALHTDVNRIVPIGITFQPNTGRTSGANVSLAAEAGYDWVEGALTHGPVAGFILQHAYFDGFTESGSFTSLSFAGQSRASAVSELGYHANLDLGIWRPFAQIGWNHEAASTDRMITASLTTVAAPSYSLPAVQLPKDWGSGTIGTTFKLMSGLTGLVSFSAQFGQSRVTSYGGRIGLNYAFDWDG